MAPICHFSIARGYTMSRVVVACCSQYLMISTDSGQTVQNTGHLFNGAAYDVKYNGSIWVVTGKSAPNTNGWNTFIATNIAYLYFNGVLREPLGLPSSFSRVYPIA
jgi:hypothetical protein